MTELENGITAKDLRITSPEVVKFGGRNFVQTGIQTEEQFSQLVEAIEQQAESELRNGDGSGGVVIQHPDLFGRGIGLVRKEGGQKIILIREEVVRVLSQLGLLAA